MAKQVKKRISENKGKSRKIGGNIVAKTASAKTASARGSSAKTASAKGSSAKTASAKGSSAKTASAKGSSAKATRDQNKFMLETVIKVAGRSKAKLIFIYADAIQDFKLPEGITKKTGVVLITRDESSLSAASRKAAKHIINVPDINMTRIGQMKIALVMALTGKLIGLGDKVVCATGVPALGVLDNILVLDIGREFEMMASTEVQSLSEQINPTVFEEVVNLSVELAHQGKEGKPIGTLLVVGDTEKVMQLSQQLIINPFKGYPEEERNILDPKLKDTIREFSSIDGAFIIRDDGVVMAAGRHINAHAEGDELPQGLGARHQAAAGITALTTATAIVISESTGMVRIFRNGRIFMEIEKPSK